MSYTPDDKLHWDVEKLKMEVMNLQRPLLRQPALWISFATLALSLGTNVHQFNSAETDKKKLQIENASLEFDAKKLRSDQVLLETRIKEATENLGQIKDEIERKKSELAKIAVIANSSDKGDARIRSNVAELQESFAALGSLVQSTSKSIASASTVAQPRLQQDFANASRLADEGYQAVAAGDYMHAQRLFQASEEAVNGYQYSYEWARLLRLRAHDLDTPEGVARLLDYAASNGYLRYAPPAVKQKLQQRTR